MSNKPVSSPTSTLHIRQIQPSRFDNVKQQWSELSTTKKACAVVAFILAIPLAISAIKLVTRDAYTKLRYGYVDHSRSPVVIAWNFLSKKIAG